MSAQRPTAITSASQARGEALAQQTHREHSVLLEAMHTLEAALAEAAPRRELAWNTRVIETLQTVEELLIDHVSSAEGPHGVLAEIDILRPTLMRRVERLRQEHAELLQQTKALRQHVAHYGDEETPNFQEIRQRATRLLNALRHHQAAETDLIFESLWTDLGASE